MKDVKPYYLGFSHFLGIGPIKLDVLLKQYDIKDAYELPESILSDIVGSQTGKKFAEFRSVFNPVKKLEELRQKKIEVVSRVDSRYPEQLRALSDAPICLYIKGNVQC